MRRSRRRRRAGRKVLAYVLQPTQRTNGSFGRSLRRRGDGGERRRWRREEETAERGRRVNKRSAMKYIRKVM